MSRYINIKGELMDLSEPKVMAIVNVTPDSFYTNSRTQTEKEILGRLEQIVSEGADIIDVGAYSSRPNAKHITEQEEMERLNFGLGLIRKHCPDAVVSIDTFRADIAKRCVENYGVDIINDISGGEMDADMYSVIASLQVPYIMMHMQGTPQNMQAQPTYDNVMKEVCLYFAERINRLRLMGVNDIIIDPGFGFGKTISHNYQLMHHLHEFAMFETPLLVGISRKSMIYNLLGGTQDDALNGTTVLNTISLMKGANILRVHDVKEAVEAVTIYKTMMKEKCV